MPKPDYSSWLTKQQAAEAIGVSTKTIEKLADEKKIQQVYWKRPETGARAAMYHPGDVARVRKERNPGAEAFVVPSGSVPELTPPTPSVDGFAHALVQAVKKASENSERQGSVRIAERLFLTYAEAAQYSGLPQSHIRRLVAEGNLEALRTGAGWRIRRRDLEKL
jgi:excisionase family DNA binding protein